MSKRIVSAVVQFIVTETNDTGEPIGEEVSQHIRVYRAAQTDIWALGDVLAFPPAPPTIPPTP